MIDSFLDAVRRLGELTMKECGEGCSEALHRGDAALALRSIVADPELVEYVKRAREGHE